MSGNCHFKCTKVFAIALSLLVCHSNAQSSFQFSSSASSSVIRNELANGRSISSGSFVGTNFAQNNNEKPHFSATGFVFNDKNAYTTQVNSETTKPFAFVIPSYASGIIDTNSSGRIPSVAPPNEELLPPTESTVANAPAFNSVPNTFTSRPIQTTTLNAIEAGNTQTPLSITQRVTAAPITQRSFITTTEEVPTTTIQSELSTIPPNQQSSFATNIPVSQFGFKLSTQSPITTTNTPTTKQFLSISPKALTTFGKPAVRPSFSFGFGSAENLSRLDVLGNQKPGFAIKSDGTVDSNAVPPHLLTHPLHTSTFLPTTPKPANVFEFTTKQAPTTINLAPNHQQSANFSHNPWLNQLTPQGTPIQQINVPFKISSNNPFLKPTTTVQTTTKAPLITTTSSIFTGFNTFATGTPTQIGFQSVPSANKTTNAFLNINANVPIQNANHNLQGSGIRDRIPTTTTTTTTPTTTEPEIEIDIRNEIPNSTPKPYNFNSAATTNKVTPNFSNNFGLSGVQGSTKPPVFNSGAILTFAKPQFFGLNSIAVTKSPLPVTTQAPTTTLSPVTTTIVPITTLLPVTQRIPESRPTLPPFALFKPFVPVTVAPGASAISVPDNDLLPPFEDSAASTLKKNDQTTLRAVTTTTIATTTTVPTTTTVSTTTTTTIPTTTQAATTIAPTQASLPISKPSLDLLPPALAVNATNFGVQLPVRATFGSPSNASTVSIHKSPAISLPSDSLLPPLSNDIQKPAAIGDITTEPNPFLPQLDLNPFLPPYTTQGQAAKGDITTTTSATPTTSSPSAPSTTSASAFDYQRPAVPFFIGNSASSSVNVQNQNGQIHVQQSHHIQSGIKYDWRTHGFGGPAGVLTPLDNSRA